MALLRGLLMLTGQSPAPIRLVVGHVNHQLRGPVADEDARWLESTCQRLGVRLVTAKANVARVSVEGRMGLEEAARHERYRLLEALALAEQCPQILLAHTADDQVETVLHHIVRGTSLTGLAGMPDERRIGENAAIVRPLLSLTRQTLDDFLRQLGQDAREDHTNRDPAMTRNRIRHELLPMLRERFNPRVGESVLRLAQQAREATAALEWTARAWLARMTLQASADQVTLACDTLPNLPRHIVRECLVLLWKNQNWPRRHMDEAHWNRAADVLLGGKAVDLPGGIHMRYRRGTCVIRRAAVSPD